MGTLGFLDGSYRTYMGHVLSSFTERFPRYLPMDVGFKQNHFIPWSSCVPSIFLFSVVPSQDLYCMLLMVILVKNVVVEIGKRLRIEKALDFFMHAPLGSGRYSSVGSSIMIDDRLGIGQLFVY